MPTIIDEHLFEIQDDYNNQYIKDSIDRARIFLNDKLDEAYSISNEIFKRIAILTIIDSLAMEFNNYPNKRSGDYFANFVLAFQNAYDFLNEVEPITLFYHYENKINKDVTVHNLYPNIQSEKLEIDLEEYPNIDNVFVPDFIKNNLSARLLDLIERQEGKTKKDSYCNKHRFVKLLYRMRSKAVHEFSGLGVEDIIERRENKELPYYREILRTYMHDNKVVTYKIYELLIPSKFLYNLADNCINNYLNYCLQHTIFPYKNNDGVMRQMYLSWYD